MALEHSRLLAASLTAGLIGVSCSTPGDAPPQQQPTETAPVADAPQEPQDPEARAMAERRRALVEKSLRVARSFRSTGDLQGAKMELLKAKEFDPSNQEVLTLLAAVQAELGEPVGTLKSWAEEQTELRRIGEERARGDVQTAMQRARTLMDEGRYPTAIEELRVAAMTIELKNDMSWGELPKQVSDMQDEAARRYDEVQRRDQAKLNAQLQDLNRRREEEAQARRIAQVEDLLLKSQQEFELRHFETSRELAQRAHDLAPEHPLAGQMLSAARKAARQSTNDEYIRQRSLEVRKLLEADEILKAPQTDVLRQDEETWVRANRRSATRDVSATRTPEDLATEEKVRTRTVGALTFTADNGDYLEVFRVLEAVTEVQIYVTAAGQTAIRDGGPKFEASLTGTETLENVLNTMVAKNPKLTWSVQFGLVVVGDKAEGAGPLLSEIYPVKDLLYERTDFLPPQIMTIPGAEGDSEVPRSGGEKEEKRPALTPDVLVELLKNASDKDWWGSTENVSMEVDQTGLLIVKAPADKQRLIDAALRDMRRFQTSIVTIDSKFLTITRNFLQEVGVDFRGLGGAGNKGDLVNLDDVTNGLTGNASTGLDNGGTGDPAANPSAGAFFNDGGDGDFRGRTENIFGSDLGRALSPTGGLTAGVTLLDDIQLNAILRAVSKQENGEVVNSQILSIVNNGRGHVAVINQTSYVRDFEVEVAQAAFIADPQVDVIQDGLVLDVHPIILNDRKYILLNLTPTVAELQRPIPTFTTSLAGSTLPVTIQLPDLTVTTFATTAKVPDGGSVLLGGLRQVLTKERRAGIPLLSNLPLVSFLFKTEGTADENSSLMVMVRAQITDVIEAPTAKN